MPKYHINTQGEVEICNAVEDDCLLGYEAHFESNSSLDEIHELIDRKIKEEKENQFLTGTQYFMFSKANKILGGGF